MLETNILHFQTFFYLTCHHLLMEDANVDRDIGHLKDFFQREE